MAKELSSESKLKQIGLLNDPICLGYFNEIIYWPKDNIIVLVGKTDLKC